MTFKKLMSFLKSILVRLRRKFSMMLIAFMLGMSNVILEETRMVGDTREHIEQQEVLPDEDLNPSAIYSADF